MKIQEYIDSGVLETFVLGSASDEEVKEILYLKTKYPEVENALKQLEQDLETIAGNMAITPPPGTWNKIEQEIKHLIPRPDITPEIFTYKESSDNKYKGVGKGDQYIEVESESNHMRIHKGWRWVFVAVFVLGKIFLGFAIYFYLENRQAQQQLQELKTEIRQLK